MEPVAPADSVMAITRSRPLDRARLAYWSIGGLLLVYVGLVTPQRLNVWGADAWEHHRVIRALTQDLWHPGNPTYATDEPSIRYSPYSVLLALLCRTTGMDPQFALSIAGVFNTALLLIALHWLLRVYGMTAAAPHVLLVMLILYGSVPGYANSLALADLPQQQVNPSALSFALALMMWALLRGTAERPSAWGTLLVVGVLGALCTLCHGHTGVFAFVALAAMAIAAPAHAMRLRLARRIAAVAAISFALCLTWPWFSFLAAVLNNQDRAYWFNPFITTIMLTVWSLPALLCVPLLLPLRRNELVRFCLLTAGVCYVLALLSFPLRSSILARIGVPAMIMLHIAIGVLIWEQGLLRPSTWKRRTRDLLAPRTTASAPAALDVLLVVALVYCLVPQLALIARNPGLARAYIAPLAGRADESLDLESKFGRLLEPVGRRDVVLSDIITSWPVPSFSGRIVAALHYETFTPDQAPRESAVKAFFAAADDRARAEILRDYDVDWILLNPQQIPPSQFDALLEPAAVIRRVDPFVLMNADAWLAARRPAFVQSR